MEMKARKIADLLKLLANEHRLLILCSLISGPLTVSEIHTFTPNITVSALSQHLNQLKTAGILESEKIGMNVKFVHFTVPFRRPKTQVSVYKGGIFKF